MNQPTPLAEPPVLYVPVVLQAKGGGEILIKQGKPLAWLTVAQLAREFGVNEDSICRWKKQGLIPAKYWRLRGLRAYEFKAATVPYLRKHFAKNR
jgi:hypothetical protein